jgi:hypothetical protein
LFALFKWCASGKSERWRERSVFELFCASMHGVARVGTALEKELGRGARIPQASLLLLLFLRAVGRPAATLRARTRANRRRRS